MLELALLCVVALAVICAIYIISEERKSRNPEPMESDGWPR